MREGRVLQPQDLALLAALGHSEVEVREVLRIGVLSTGDELAPPGSTFNPERTYDANRPMLLSIAERWGYRAVDLGHVRDNRGAASNSAGQGCREADVILTSGGASAGEEDHVSALLGEAGAMALWRIAVKPGRPLALGLWEGVPIFGLPGNPVAAFVCALIFARPALGLLAGAGWSAPQGFQSASSVREEEEAGSPRILARKDISIRARGGLCV